MFPAGELVAVEVRHLMKAETTLLVIAGMGVLFVAGMGIGAATQPIEIFGSGS